MNPFRAVEWVFEQEARTAPSWAGLIGPRRRAAVAAWVLGIATVASPPAARGEPMAVTSPEATRQVLVPALEVIGTSFTVDDGVGMTRPIYSVIVGDPRPAEERAYAWADRFGMYALDANLWTRAMQTSDAHWRQTILHRPRTVKEVEIFADTPGAFKVEIFGRSNLLPFPFHDLPERELSSIEYVVQYFLGGTRAELRVGATRDDAETILGHVLYQMKRR